MSEIPDLDREAAELERLIAERDRLRAELAAERARHLQTLHDISDDMECLQECDSYGHAELCPVTNTAVAWKRLRDDLAAERAAREDAEKAAAMWRAKAALENTNGIR